MDSKTAIIAGASGLIGRSLTQELLDKISKKLLSWNDLLRMGVLEMIDWTDVDCGTSRYDLVMGRLGGT